MIKWKCLIISAKGLDDTIYNSECPICLENVCYGTNLDCGHRYHANCIKNWKKTGNDSCPICRN